MLVLTTGGLSDALGHRWLQIIVSGQTQHVDTILLAVRQAASYETFCFVTDDRLIGKLHLGRLQNGVLLEDRRLRQIMTERLLTVKALIENHADTPHVDFGRYFRRVLADHEAFRRQIPVRAGSLRRQVHTVVRIVILFVHDLAQTEIGDFYFAANVALY